jgi:hypothetical protein
MTRFIWRPALAASALLAVAACASPDEYDRTAASYPSGTLVTAPGATVTYPSGTTVYYPPATAALPRAATDPSSYDATRRNSQSVGGGTVRMGTSVPMEGGN